MSNDIVAKWLKCYVGDSHFRDSFWGYYDFSSKTVKQNVGSVYGIWVKATQEELDDYMKKHKSNLKEFKGYLPLYWGKDISPCARLCAHLEKPQETGSIDLINSKYAERDIVFGCILTKEYSTIEQRLHKEYPPLCGTNGLGRPLSKRDIIE